MHELIQEYEPIKITYINNLGREIEAYGVYSYPTIRIGSQCFFRAIHDDSELFKSTIKSSRKIGTIVNFEYLDIKRS